MFCSVQSKGSILGLQYAYFLGIFTGRYLISVMLIKEYMGCSVDGADEDI